MCYQVWAISNQLNESGIIIVMFLSLCILFMLYWRIRRRFLLVFVLSYCLSLVYTLLGLGIDEDRGRSIVYGMIRSLVYTATVSGLRSELIDGVPLTGCGSRIGGAAV